MKKNRIYEQADPTAAIIHSPKNEWERFQSGPLGNKIGTIVNLCVGPNGLPRELRVGGRTYFIAKKTEKGNYLTYDGRVLVKGNGNCEYTYKLDDKGQPVRLTADIGLELPMKKELLQFGINPDDPKVNIYDTLDQVTKYLRVNLVNRGAVSGLFKLWNSMLAQYYPNDYDTVILKPVAPNTTLEIPKDVNELTAKYNKGNGDNLSIKYNGEPFIFYLPKSSNLNIKGNKVNKDQQYCETTLATYLINALQVKAGVDQPLPQLQTIKSELSTCYGNGKFDNFGGFTKETMDPSTRKKLSPYGFLNKKLSFREIKKLLKSEKIAPSHNFDFDNTVGNQAYNPQLNENTLRNVVRKKLTVLSEDKQKTLLSETKIITSRFNIIKESNNDNDKVLTELFNESFELVNLGLNPKLITEGLFDSLKGMFGIGTEGILGYFKEKIVETLLNKLGIDTDSWIAGIIVKAIGNIPMADYFSGKILTCDYLTPLLTKSIVEEAIKKVGDKAGLTGGFVDVLRNSLVQGLDSTDFAQSVERGVASILCPVLSKIGDNMENIFTSMKQKALS